MKVIRTSIFLVVFALILAACQEQPATYRTVEPFTFIDQHGNAFGLDDLDGSIWVANFIFTNCTSVCPTSTMGMANIQAQLNEEDLNVHLVSFTVDPENDTPEQLKNYIQKYTNDDGNWHLLTGYTQAEIEQFAEQQFQTIVQKLADSDQIIHGSNYYLVDQHGQIINKYHYSDHSYIETLLSDIKNLIN